MTKTTVPGNSGQISTSHGDSASASGSSRARSPRQQHLLGADNVCCSLTSSCFLSARTYQRAPPGSRQQFQMYMQLHYCYSACSFLPLCSYCWPCLIFNFLSRTTAILQRYNVLITVPFFSIFCFQTTGSVERAAWSCCQCESQIKWIWAHVFPPER